MRIDHHFKDEGVRSRLEENMEDAEIQGFNFIELRLGVIDSYGEMICGLDEIRIQRMRKPGDNYPSIANPVLIKDGILQFYPDTRGRCWGYLVDTPRNRDWLAAGYRKRRYMIVDKQIENAIIDIAVEKGYGTEKVRDKTLEGMVKDKDKKKVFELEQKLEEAERERDRLKTAVEQKPLKNRKVTRARQSIRKVED